MHLLVGVIVSILAFQVQAQEATQKYKITFTSNWNLEDHLGLPGRAHFSPIVAIGHSDDYQLLPMGGMATAGLERVAELGDAAELNTEIQGEIDSGTVVSALNTKNMFINDQATQTFEVEVSETHPNFSFVSMIAPSPDWVVGLDSMKLFSKKMGFFKGKSRSITLYGINAGTESGDKGGNFSLRNRPTNPREEITRLAGEGFKTPFAFVTIESI